MSGLEERILYFNGITVRLAYTGDGNVDMLRLELTDGRQIVIRSTSMPIAPEKIYELLGECDIT